MPIRADEVRRAKFKELLAPLYRTPEFADVDAFLVADRDMEGIPNPFDTLLWSAFDHQTRVSRKQRKAAERTAATLKDLGLDPQPETGPADTTTIPTEELVHRVNHGEPYHKDLCRVMWDSGWNFTGRSTSKITPEEDKNFLEDMIKEYTKDYPLVTDAQKERIKLTGRDFIKWWRKTESERAGKTNGSI